MTPDRTREWMLHWQELQETHAASNRAIDTMEWWGKATIWGCVFLVPLLVTVPCLVWAWYRLRQLKHKADAITARAVAWGEAPV